MTERPNLFQHRVHALCTAVRCSCGDFLEVVHGLDEVQRSIQDLYDIEHRHHAELEAKWRAETWPPPVPNYWCVTPLPVSHDGTVRWMMHYESGSSCCYTLDQALHLMCRNVRTRRESGRL